MKKLKVTLVTSPIPCLEKPIRTLEALGLHKLHQSVIHNDTPAIRGMIFVVKHMVTVEEIEQ